MGDPLTADIIELARQYGRYGYRKIAALLGTAAWDVNDKRVERIWRREGLKVPRKRAALAQRRLVDPSAATTSQSRMVLRLRRGSQHDGRKYRMRNVMRS